jgi:hypothetical protein
MRSDWGCTAIQIRYFVFLRLCSAVEGSDLPPANPYPFALDWMESLAPISESKRCIWSSSRRLVGPRPLTERARVCSPALTRPRDFSCRNARRNTLRRRLWVNNFSWLANRLILPSLVLIYTWPDEAGVRPAQAF